MPGFNAEEKGPQAQNPDAAADPSGALAFYDAVNKELGVKLEKSKASGAGPGDRAHR